MKPPGKMKPLQLGFMSRKTRQRKKDKETRKTKTRDKEKNKTNTLEHRLGI